MDNDKEKNKKVSKNEIAELREAVLGYINKKAKEEPKGDNNKLNIKEKREIEMKIKREIKKRDNKKIDKPIKELEIKSKDEANSKSINKSKIELKSEQEETLNDKKNKIKLKDKIIGVKNTMQENKKEKVKIKDEITKVKKIKKKNGKIKKLRRKSDEKKAGKRNLDDVCDIDNENERAKKAIRESIIRKVENKKKHDDQSIKDICFRWMKFFLITIFIVSAFFIFLALVVYNYMRSI